jgi:hypothetical protein
MIRVLLAALLLCGCTINYPESPDGCPAACARLGVLSCEAGKPTPDGATCEQVCSNVQASGLNRINTECIAAADSCAAAEEC